MGLFQVTSKNGGVMRVLIKTFSDQETKNAIKTRELLELITKQRVYIVPKGVSCLFISIDEKNNNDLVVYVTRDGEEGPTDLDIVRGFESITECWEYARVIAKESGLSDEDIDADVWEETSKHQ